jgi:hypothetical protein
MSNHVVDTDDAERHFTAGELAELFKYEHSEPLDTTVVDPLKGEDPGMAQVMGTSRAWLAVRCSSRVVRQESLLLSRMPTLLYLGKHI